MWDFLKVFKKKEVVEIQQPLRVREDIKQRREALYKKVVEDLRKEQIGKEGAMKFDETKLKHKADPERISDELGIPPTRYYIKPDAIIKIPDIKTKVEKHES